MIKMIAESASPCLFEGWSRGLRRRNGLVEFGGDVVEMAYGVAPFFVNDIRQTYIRIMNHEVCHLLLDFYGIDCRHVSFVHKSLRFDQKTKISHEY